jgi:hypothetical protein
MRPSDSLIPDFSPGRKPEVVPAAPAAPRGPIDREIRRINSAHEPAVREVASDNELGRGIVDDDARRLAAQKKSVRRNERAKHDAGDAPDAGKRDG